MEKFLKTLDIIKKKVREEDYDMVIVISGKGNRYGKSTLGIQTASYLEDEQFSLERVAWDEQDCNRILRTIKKGQVINIDDAQRVLLSYDHNTRGTKSLIRTIMDVAAKNIIYIIVIPNFFMLHRYIRMDKIDLLLYVYKRGRFWVYGKSQIEKILDRYGKVKYKKSFKMPPSNLEDTFEKLDNEFWMQYTQKKMEMLDVQIDKRMHELQMEEDIDYTIAEFCRLYNVNLEKAIEMIENQIIKTKKDDLGQIRISKKEALRFQEMQILKVKENMKYKKYLEKTAEIEA